MVKFRHGFKARANDIALGLRKQAGLAQTAPLDPRDVFQRLSIQIVPLAELSSGLGVPLDLDRRHARGASLLVVEHL